MSLSEVVYLRLQVPLKQAALHYFGRKLEQQRYATAAQDEREWGICLVQGKSWPELQALQDQRLAALAQRARELSPFWAERLAFVRKNGIAPLAGATMERWSVGIAVCYAMMLPVVWATTSAAANGVRKPIARNSPPTSSALASKARSSSPGCGSCASSSSRRSAVVSSPTEASKRWLAHSASPCPRTWTSCTPPATRCSPSNGPSTR